MKKIKTGKNLFMATALFIFLSSTLYGQDFSTLYKKVNEARKQGNRKMADSIAQIYINDYLFKVKGKDLFNKDDLSFMSQYLGNANSKAFKLFMKERIKVNTILGKDRAEYAIRYLIRAEYFKDIDGSKESNFDWTSLKKDMLSKFSQIGLETLYGRQMIYYLGVMDWNNYGKAYMLYFEKALKRPEYDINNMSWYLFANINDVKILKFACNVVMKYAMEEWYQTDVNAYDTYANLLHKIGNTTEAIRWEEKAIQMKKGQSDERLYTDALEKMKKGLPTWITSTDK